MSFSVGLLVGTLATVQFASATLGETADSVTSDRMVISAVQGATTVHNDFTVQEIGSHSTTIREYISPTGIVFGIAWNGMVHPDLTKLLGTYSGEYQEALKQAHYIPGRRFSQIKTENIVVETWGHMRNVQGHAYVTTLIPPGVSVDDIK